MEKTSFLFGKEKVNKAGEFYSFMSTNYSISEKERIGKQYWEEQYNGDNIIVFEYNNESNSWERNESIEKDVLYVDEFNNCEIDMDLLDQYINNNKIIAITFSDYNFYNRLPINKVGEEKYKISNILKDYKEMRNIEIFYNVDINTKNTIIVTYRGYIFKDNNSDWTIIDNIIIGESIEEIKNKLKKLNKEFDAIEIINIEKFDKE